MKIQNIPDKIFTFRFNNDRKEEAYYDIIVTIKNVREGNFYDITYDYYFRSGSYDDPKKIKLYRCLMHPFYLRGGLTQYSLSDEKNNIDGVIVCKNPITTAMINMLSMPDSELERQCGNFSTQKYRQNIMISLCYL